MCPWTGWGAKDGLRRKQLEVGKPTLGDEGDARGERA